MNAVQIDPRAASGEIDVLGYRVEFFERAVIDTWFVDEVGDVAEAQAWADLKAGGRPYVLSAEIPSPFNPGTTLLVRLTPPALR